MDSSRTTFPKNERLSLKHHLDILFQEGLSFVVYPIRVIYLPLAIDPSNSFVSLLISVPKRKIKHAVDRNYIKRRIRESYRLRKHDLIRFCLEKEKKLLLAFIYLDDEKSSFKKIDRAMNKVTHTLQEKIGETEETGEAISPSGVGIGGG